MKNPTKIPTSQGLPPDISADSSHPQLFFPKKWNLRLLAQLTGFDRRTLADRLKNAQIRFEQGPKNSKLYLLDDAMPVIYASSTNATLSTDNESDKRRLAAAKAELAELQLAKQKNEVINAEDALAAVTESFAEVRTGLLNLAPSLATKLATLDNPEIIATLIDEKIAEALAPLHFELAEQQTDEIPDDSTDVQNEA